MSLYFTDYDVIINSLKEKLSVTIRLLTTMCLELNFLYTKMILSFEQKPRLC